MIEWLDTNDGVVQSVTTVALTILTFIYVILTRKIAIAAQEQTRLVREEREREAKRSLESLRIGAERLLDELSRLPNIPSGTDSECNHPGWTPTQLGDFIVFARMIPGVDEGNAMNVTSALKRIDRLIDQTKEVSRIQGRRYSDKEINAWQEDRNVAMTLLNEIIATTKSKRNSKIAT